MSATEELRAMLDERGVEWRERKWGGKHSVTTFWRARGVRWHYRENRFGEVRLHADDLTPAQAIVATLGDTDATEERQRVAGKVYLVETSNELLESWCPFGVYLSREAAEDCAEALTYEHDGIRNFAMVHELKVVDE